jgi:NADH dehydrogenase
MPRLLNEYRAPWASREALRVLDCRGVSVYLDTAVERVEEGNLFVNDRRMMRAATMVWSAGIRAPQLLADAGLPTDARGRVHVNSFLQLEAYPDIYAIGDCAQIPDTMGGIVPTTASYAIRQGAFLADALIDELDSRPPASRYGYEPLALGSVVSLGPGAAVGDVLGVPVRGAVAALMKHTVEQQYRKSLR